MTSWKLLNKNVSLKYKPLQFQTVIVSLLTVMISQTISFEILFLLHHWKIASKSIYHRQRKCLQPKTVFIHISNVIVSLKKKHMKVEICRK